MSANRFEALPWTIARLIASTGRACLAYDNDVTLDATKCEQLWNTSTGAILVISFIDLKPQSVICARMKCRSDHFIVKVDSVDDASLDIIVKNLLDWAESVRFIVETYSGEDALGAGAQDQHPFKRTLHTSMQDAMQE